MTYFQPSSTEPANGILSQNDEEDENTEDGSTGVSTRSVSSTIHDRTKISASAPASGHVSSTSSTTTMTTRQSRSRHHHNHHHDDSSRRPSSTAPTLGAGSNTAKDTFLNYFFGQSENGSANPTPSAVSGSVGTVGLSAAMTSGLAPSGRDTAQSSAPTGLLAGKMGPDGNYAAYDMKSLGRHIEAVSFTK